MPLTQHEFYVYYDGSDVFARRRAEPPVLAETLDSPQAAHDRVQEIVNPDGKSPYSFGAKGFHEEAFQRAISDNCRAYVEEAYGRAQASDTQ